MGRIEPIGRIGVVADGAELGWLISSASYRVEYEFSLF